MDNGEIAPRLLSLDPSKRERQELLGNILDVYGRATDRQRSKGMAWYSTAHDLAEMVGGGDVTKGAGIIAALSQNTGWNRNAELAIQVAAGQEVGHFDQVVSKVKRIVEGQNPITVLTGLKTWNFYRNIKDPDESQAVTIDRHAHDIARDQRWGNRGRGLSTAKRYNVLADAYRDAATLAYIRPHEMQAVTWVVWTEESTNPRIY